MPSCPQKQKNNAKDAKDAKERNLSLEKATKRINPLLSSVHSSTQVVDTRQTYHREKTQLI